MIVCIAEPYVLGCDDMLKKLEKERELLTSRTTFTSENDAFGTGHRQEIIEPYEEEEDKKWRGKSGWIKLKPRTLL